MTLALASILTVLACLGWPIAWAWMNRPMAADDLDLEGKS